MLIPVILSGGAGTRLWPVSREALPKPFMRLGGSLSLLQRTLARALPLADGGRAAIVTNHEYFFKTRDEIGELPAGPRHAGDPAARADGAQHRAGDRDRRAVGAGDRGGRDAARAAGRPPDPRRGRVPGRRARLPRAHRRRRLDRAVRHPARPRPKPDSATSRPASRWPDGGALRVRRFVEKPDAARAVQFLQAGNFVWNSGMFCFRADAILAALGEHAPDVLAAARAAWEASRDGASDEQVAIDADTFARCPDISIDYAVMERAGNVVALPSRFGWSDIGSWTAVAEQLPADAGRQHHRRRDDAGRFAQHARPERRTAGRRGRRRQPAGGRHPRRAARRQQGRQPAGQGDRRPPEGQRPRRRASCTGPSRRPWGTYTVLLEGPRFKIKRIEVKPAPGAVAADAPPPQRALDRGLAAPRG